MNELVSIIMPNYNCGKYVVETIESVLAQTYEDWELIFVDDCSTDNSVDIVKSFQDDRIKIFENEKNSGAAVTRNRALREAKGKWIAFLDSDDLWAPDKLQKQVAFMKDNGYVFSYTEYVRIDEESKPLGIYVSGPKVVTKRKMYHYSYPGCLTFMYDAKAMGLVQIEDIKKNNDYAILLILCKKANCYLLKENLAKYRIRKKSISHDKFLKKIKSHYELFRKCDKRSTFMAFWYASWNLFYGVLKKIRYEKTLRNKR